MPLVKVHRKKDHPRFGEEASIRSVMTKFFSLPEEVIFLFSLDDINEITHKNVLVEIEIKKRSTSIINEFILELRKVLPEVDVITVKMFEEDITVFDAK